MSPLERQAIRRSLDGAVLNVALLAASLHADRLLVARCDCKGRYSIKHLGARHALITTASVETAVKFLDQLGMPS